MMNKKLYCTPLAELIPVRMESTILQGSIEPADPVDGSWSWEDNN
jgi:hypothetical protein